MIAYGRLLDLSRFSRSHRAWTAFLLWLLPQIACFIWIGINYGHFGQSSTTLDYTTEPVAWAKAYIPYLIIFVTGYWTQLSLYWILGSLSKDMQSSSRTGGLFRAFETAGQAVSYGINSASGTDRRMPFFLNCGILVLAVPCMVALIRMVGRSEEEEEVEGGGLEVVEEGGKRVD